MSDTNTLNSISEIDFTIVREYLSTGDSSVLSPDRKYMLSVAKDAWSLLQRYPQRGVCIKQLMALHAVSYKTAARYVDFARDTWGDYLGINQKFLQTYLLNQLVKEISNPSSSEANRAKNLATLQKHLASMPQKDIDPTLMESNSVFIQFNMGEKSFTLPQRVIKALPNDIQEELFASLNTEVTDAEVVEILNS